MMALAHGNLRATLTGVIGLALLLIVPACGSQSNSATAPSSVQIKGNAQKGPLLAGSLIEAHPLDATLTSTGAVYTTQLLSDLGSFDFTRTFPEGFLEVIAQGFFYDELTAQLSGAPLTLRALASTSSSADLRVNIATTVCSDRIRRLVEQGMAFDAAAAQAKLEFFQIFKLDATSYGDLNHMDITGTTPGDTALIAVSATLLQYASERAASAGQKVAELAAVIAGLSAELETDGVVNSTTLLRDLAASAHRLDLQAVKTNLEAIYAGRGVTLTVSDLAPYTTPLGSEWPWRMGIAAPAVRIVPSGTAVGGLIYLVGGMDQSNPEQATGDVQQFNASTGTWTAKVPMPTPRFSHSCVELGGHLFAIGGRGTDVAYHTVVEEYNPTSNSWAVRASLPEARYGACGASAGGKIYVIGGGSASIPYTNTVYRYDPVGNSWDSRAAMPTARGQAGCAVIDGKIYVVGGGAFSVTAAVEVYDPAANSWTTKASLPLARSGCSVAALNGKIYAIAGNDNAGKVTTNLVYDPDLNQWAPKTPLDIPRFLAVPAVLNNDIYVIGTSVIGTVSAEVEIYSPSKDN